ASTPISRRSRATRRGCEDWARGSTTSGISTATITRPTSSRQDSTSGSEPGRRREEHTVRRSILLTITLSMAAAVPLSASTVAKARIAPDLGLDSFPRGVTRQQLSRDLFSNPYATVTVGSVDVYDRFPYVETRTFQVVSDPQWNRLITGEMGKSLSAYD